jgi:hypothetical protein
MPIIGFLHSGTEDAYTNAALAAFRRGLQETGYVEGQNVAIEYRSWPLWRIALCSRGPLTGRAKALPVFHLEIEH